MCLVKIFIFAKNDRISEIRDFRWENAISIAASLLTIRQDTLSGGGQKTQANVTSRRHTLSSAITSEPAIFRRDPVVAAEGEDR